MSGGSYDYAYCKIHDLASSIKLEGGCGEGYCAPPELRRRFKKHLDDVAEAARAIEWNDSGDGDDEEAAKILRCLSPQDSGRAYALELAESLEKQAAALRASFSATVSESEKG